MIVRGLRFLAASAVGLFAVGAASLTTTPVLAAKSASCDEACLKGFMDAYLGAMEKHNPSLVPVAAHYRYTENGAQLKLGEALWVTFNSWGKYRHDVFDTQTRGVVSFLS